MIRRAVVLTGLLLAGCEPTTASPDALAPVVFSAASTADVVRALADGATVSVAASSVLARQIARGAPADVFVTADPAWIDWLEAEGTPILSRGVVARGRLVVVGPVGERPGADVLGGRLALADPTHVPAGRYAEATLRATGQWDALEKTAIRTGDVRAALAAVETGAADRAIIYASDAAASPRVRVLHMFSERETGPIRFEVALLSPAGRILFEHLLASESAWAEAGFGPASP